MRNVKEEAWEVHQFLTDLRLPYAIIVRFCSPEDLIIHKTIAGRVQDVIDVQHIIARQKKTLDLPYIRYWLGVFAELLETSDVIDRFEQAWLKYGPAS